MRPLRYWRQRYAFLMVTLASVALFPALSLVFGDYSEWVFALCYLMLIVSSLYWIQAHPRERLVGFALATLAFLSIVLPNLIQWIYPDVRIKLLLSVSAIGFFSYLIYTLLREILRSNRTTVGVIYGSVAGYLTLGLLGAFWMRLIDEIHPGSFHAEQESLAQYDYVYFSFVSMTTTGFGDILPQNPPAKAVVMVGIVLGQVYLTILMAFLVGRFLKESQRK
ncbi:hypothetical protein GC167_03300 [bacterium]|nr:hypothetical protein [bacterium]